MRERANFVVIANESNDTRLVIRDVGPWDRHPSVTNDVENVVYRLVHTDGLLKSGMRLFYYDSANVSDEIVVKNGAFSHFAPGSVRS